jgi:CheY-like chemotaxis protein
MAILNLAVNARDAMPQGGIIRITARLLDATHASVITLAPGTYIALCVSDSGEGMDAATLARATEPFFTTKGVGKGTGLGLSMIHGLAKQLGGDFTLDSAPALGTQATLWLPVAPSEAVPQFAGQADDGAQEQPASLKILAVDDDGLILMNTAALLEDLGHQVLEAGSGEEALMLMRDHEDIDVLITDQAMPKMTGTQLIDQVTQMRAELPVILASGYGDVPEGAQQRIIRLGKPFTQDMLERAIRQATSQSGG